MCLNTFCKVKACFTIIICSDNSNFICLSGSNQICDCIRINFNPLCLGIRLSFCSGKLVVVAGYSSCIISCIGSLQRSECTSSCK